MPQSDLNDRIEEPAVRYSFPGRESRDCAPHDDGKNKDRPGGQNVNHPPSEDVRHYATDHSGQQDASQKPRSHSPENAPALFIGRKIPGEWQQHLPGHVSEADQRKSCQQEGKVRRQETAPQSQGTANHNYRYQALPVHGVTERHDEEHPERVADLSERYEKSGGTRHDAQVRGNVAKEWLGPVQVSDACTANESKEKSQAQVDSGSFCLDCVCG